jgi:hypothetical protein
LIDHCNTFGKNTGKPTGFGFVVFSDPSVLDRVLEDKHVIDGRTVGFVFSFSFSFNVFYTLLPMLGLCECLCVFLFKNLVFFVLDYLFLFLVVNWRWVLFCLKIKALILRGVCLVVFIVIFVGGVCFVQL